MAGFCPVLTRTTRSAPGNQTILPENHEKFAKNHLPTSSFWRVFDPSWLIRGCTIWTTIFSTREITTNTGVQESRNYQRYFLTSHIGPGQKLVL